MKENELGIITRLKRSYILALTCIALLASASCIILVKEIDHRESSSRIINISGRQRMLSQNIVKNLLIINNGRMTSTNGSTAPVVAESRKQLQETLASWQAGHNGLLNGDALLNIPRLELSQVNAAYFKDITPFYIGIADVCEAILGHEFIVEAPEINVTQLLSDEKRFLALMDKITFQFDKEAKAEMVKLKKYEIIFLVITIITLLLEAVFIFSPMVTLVQKNILDYNRLFEEKQQQELKSLDAIVQTQEAERQRIANDLHDGIAQMLSLVKINVSTIEGACHADEKIKQSIGFTQKLIDRITDELRTVSYNLMPSTLSNFGLLPALDETAERIANSSPLRLKLVKHTHRESYGTKIDVGIYRIVQELISNALKHSEATEMLLQIVEHEDILIISFENDGNGYDHIHEQEQDDSKGLKNMMSHARNINGSFHFDTVKQGEIVITLEVPIGR